MANALDGWVSEATRWLSKDSAAQVRSEIGEHFEESRVAAVHAGANQAEAEYAALTALGDAGKVNREYRDALMTNGDARLLREGNMEAKFFCANRPVRLALLALPGLALMASGLLFYQGKADIARTLLLGGITLAVVFVMPFLPVYTKSRSRIARFVKWMVLAGLPLLAFGGDALKYSWLLIAVWSPIAWVEWRRMALRRKLPIEQWPKQLYL